MSDSQGQRYWSDNPNAPKIPYWAYFAEKSYFAGNILASVLYGACKVSTSSVRLSVFQFLRSSRDSHRVVLPMHGRIV